MRLVSMFLLCLLASTAAAAECDRWTASMEEDEGGPRMTAAICARASANAPDEVHYLLVQCGAEGSLSMRYLPFAASNYPPGGDEEFNTDMKFSIDRATFAKRAHYEAMDAAMVMEADRRDPLVEALMGGGTFTLSDAKGKVPAVTFTLSGARDAFGTLVGSCGQ